MWYIVRQYAPNGEGFFERVEFWEKHPPRNTVLDVYIGPYASKQEAEAALNVDAAA
jgi:hypothetical protein